MTTLSTLKTWNYAACLLHFFAMIFTIVAIKSDNAKAIVYRNAFDDSVDNVSRVDTPVKLETSGTANLKTLIAAFFGITSASHFVYATDFFGRGWYSKTILGTGWNPFRWYEYGLSAAIMIYIISIVSGTKEQITAVSSALIVPSLMLQGYSVEGLLHQNQLRDWSDGLIKKKPVFEALVIWNNFIPAWLLFAVNWYIILGNFGKISREAKAADKPIDSSVSFLVYSQLVFFSLFGVIQTYQVYRWTTARPGRHEAGYIEYEKAYIVLSAVTKFFLAGTVVYALR